MRRALTDQEYFADRVEVGENECWEWMSHRNGDGYGVFSRQGKSRYAHRIAYELFVGSIPKGLTIDHLCRNRGCVNPAHLEPVTAKENVLRSPYTWGGRNRLRTYCEQGHPFDKENTVYPKRGGRECRTCRNEATRIAQERKRREAGMVERDLFCKNGHPRTPENVYEWRGRRRCRDCETARRRKPGGYKDPNRKAKTA